MVGRNNIQDDKTLQHYIAIDITWTMEKIRKFLVKMIKESVQEIVYDPYEGRATVYERQHENGGFIGSWVASELAREMQNNSQTWSTKLFSDPSKMTFDADRFIHGNSTQDEFYFGVGDAPTTESDRRSHMDEYLAEGTNYDFPDPSFLVALGDGLFPNYDIWWTAARDYWTPMIEWWVTAGGIGAEFVEIMMGLGVTFDFNM